MAQTAAPNSARMAKSLRVSQGHPKPAFAEKVERWNQGKFFKNPPKSSPCLKGPKALWRKLNYTLIKMHLKCKDWKYFGANSGSKSVRMGKLWQLSQGHPKPAFSGKEQRGDQGKFFKNRPKSSRRLKGPNALLRKWHYSLICMHLDYKDWKRF